MTEKKTIRLSLDYDGRSRGADEEHEYATPEEREGFIADYVHFHAERIAEMAGVEDLADVERPEDYLSITEGA